MFPFNSKFKRKRSTKNKYSNTAADCKIETGCLGRRDDGKRSQSVARSIQERFWSCESVSPAPKWSWYDTMV